MRLKNSVLFCAIIFLSTHIFGQTQITFDDQGWSADQSLNSSFVIGNTVFSGSKSFYTNYGYNLNVNNTGIYFVFQNSTDQLTIAKTDSKLYNLRSLAAYQVSEAGSGNLVIEGWSGSNKLYTSTFTNVKSWQDLTLNFKNVNKVTIRSEIAAGDSLTDYNFDNFVFDSNTTSVDQGSQVTVYNLEQNYPNPFNPSTLINYQIPQGGMVTLKVYDAIGNEVSTLVNENQAAGSHSAIFNAGNLASGFYIYKLSSNGYISSKKMLLVK